MTALSQRTVDTVGFSIVFSVIGSLSVLLLIMVCCGKKSNSNIPKQAYDNENVELENRVDQALRMAKTEENETPTKLIPELTVRTVEVAPQTPVAVAAEANVEPHYVPIPSAATSYQVTKITTTTTTAKVNPSPPEVNRYLNVCPIKTTLVNATSNSPPPINVKPTLTYVKPKMNTTALKVHATSKVNETKMKTLPIAKIETQMSTPKTLVPDKPTQHYITVSSNQNVEPKADIAAQESKLHYVETDKFVSKVGQMTGKTIGQPTGKIDYKTKKMSSHFTEIVADGKTTIMQSKFVPTVRSISPSFVPPKFQSEKKSPMHTPKDNRSDFIHTPKENPGQKVSVFLT